MNRRSAARALLYPTAALVGLFSVGPFLWMVLTAIKPQHEISTKEPVFWPSEVVLERFASLFGGDFSRYLFNSFLVAAATVVIGVTIAALAGYALARFDLPMKRYLLLVMLSVQMFPLVVLIIPMFMVMRSLDLLDTYFALIISYLAFTTPLATWILRGFFISIPRELEEAAMVDGATRMGAIVRVIMPLAGPGIAATSILVFISAWNEFIFALTFINDETLRTLPVALNSLLGRATADWGTIMAGSVLFTLPIVIFFLLVHRRMTEGMISGAVKG